MLITKFTEEKLLLESQTETLVLQRTQTLNEQHKTEIQSILLTI